MGLKRSARCERPIYLGSSVSWPDAEPMAALGTIQHVDAAARHNARRYIRDAREAGHSWHDIGAALGMTGGTGYGETLAEVAYTYAAGDLDSAYAGRLRPVVHLDLPVV